jgi:polyisoprenoid-binding protein YceI
MRGFLTTAVLVAALTGASVAGTFAPAWQIGSPAVTVTCPLTVGGRFEAKTKALGGRLEVDAANPARLSGSLSVDLATLETGISLRDAHLRDRYLEIGKGDGYSHAVLSDITLVSGQAATVNGRTEFTGTLRVHGTTRPVRGQATVTRTGTRVTVDATFPVSLTAFTIPEPRYLGVGVRDEVRVRATFVATEAQ